LSESTWDHELINQRRLELLVIDDTGDRKDGSATAHVARQYLGSVGKTDNGILTQLRNGAGVGRATSAGGGPGPWSCGRWT
jgi:SRSO17 transposase